MSQLIRNIRYALRQLRKSPGFTVAAVLTLALGIGANLAVFVILYGILIRPLPFPQPQQIVRIERFYTNGSLNPAYSGTKALLFQRANRTLESVAAYDFAPAHVNLIQGSEAVPLEALRVTSEFFHLFQMEPELGHSLSLQDMTPNAPEVAVISDAVWRQRFGADTNILGQAITLGTEKYTIIGVANPKFRLDSKADIWVPLRIAESPTDQSNQYNVVARLKAGVTLVQAQDDLKRVLFRLKDTYPKLWDRNEAIRVIDFHDSVVGEMRPALQTLMGAVGLVLLIVSANVLSLLLTRSIARRREMSLRTALGATVWQILSQLVIENALLCLLGGALGLLFAESLLPLLMHLSPIELPQFTSLNIDGPSLVFTGLLILACILLFSIVPIFESWHTQLNESLRMNSTQIAGGRHWAQKSLVVGEVAISLILLVGSALLLTSFWKLVHTSAGFSAENTLTFKTSFNDEQARTGAAFGQLLNQLAQRLEATPGVESAAAVNSLPMQLTPDLPFDIIGRSSNQKDSNGDAKYIPITSHFFSALQIPILEGRVFSSSDTHGAVPVVIVNHKFAQDYFPGRSPIGEHILIGAAMGPGFEDSIREIVGVVGDTKQDGLDKAPPEMMYLPAAQVPDTLAQMENHLTGVSWVIRSRSENLDITSAARHIFWDEARTPLLSVSSMQEIMSASVAQQRFTMLLLSAFGCISLILGGLGLYGVMSYAVARQTKEIGVRMAIGAQREDISRMVLRQAGLLVLLGMAIGAAISFAGARLLSSLLFDIAPHDPLPFVGMCLLLLITGFFSAWWPARRAAATEPMQALRTE